MADKILKMSLDVTKLNKAWFFTGEKGVYAGVTLLYREQPDQYGNNGMVVQDVPKEIYEKEKGKPKEEQTKGNILGNAREFSKSSTHESYFSKEDGTKAKSPAATAAGTDEDEDDGDLPF